MRPMGGSVRLKRLMRPMGGFRDIRAGFRRLLARRADSCKGPEGPENQDEGHGISLVTVSESLL